MPLPDLAESLSSRTEAPRQDGAKFLSVHTCTIFLHNSFVFHTYAILARNSFVSHTCARRRKKSAACRPAPLQPHAPTRNTHVKSVPSQGHVTGQDISQKGLKCPLRKMSFS